MKKKKLKMAVHKAIKKYYGNMGFTATAAKLKDSILDEIDREYKKLHK